MKVKTKFILIFAIVVMASSGKSIDALKYVNSYNIETEEGYYCIQMKCNSQSSFSLIFSQEIIQNTLEEIIATDDTVMVKYQKLLIYLEPYISKCQLKALGFPIDALK